MRRKILPTFVETSRQLLLFAISAKAVARCYRPFLCRSHPRSSWAVLEKPVGLVLRRDQRDPGETGASFAAKVEPRSLMLHAAASAAVAERGVVGRTRRG